jgi:hypothetical protein
MILLLVERVAIAEYCGKGCKSNCDAKAPCGKYAAEGNSKCPLNVCCGKYDTHNVR